MREYACVSPKFWTGETGRRLRRQGSEVQVVALYLITAPGSNMIGLYYLPLPTLCHETGLSPEGASEALRSLSEGGFAHYDAVAEVVWVPEMALFQVGDTLKPRDNRHKAVVREWEAHRKCRFFKDFHAKYRKPFNLPEMSPSEGASEPLRSQEQEQEQEQEQDPSLDPAAAGPEKSDSGKAPKPSKPRVANLLFDAVAEVCGSDPTVNGAHVGKVAALLAKANPPYTPAEVREFGRRFRQICTWAAKDDRTRPELGELQNHIGKIRSAKPLRVAAPKPPVEHDRSPPPE